VWSNQEQAEDFIILSSMAKPVICNNLGWFLISCERQIKPEDSLYSVKVFIKSRLG